MTSSKQIPSFNKVDFLYTKEGTVYLQEKGTDGKDNPNGKYDPQIDEFYLIQEDMEGTYLSRLRESDPRIKTIIADLRTHPMSFSLARKNHFLKWLQNETDSSDIQINFIVKNLELSYQDRLPTDQDIKILSSLLTKAIAKKLSQGKSSGKYNIQEISKLLETGKHFGISFQLDVKDRELLKSFQWESHLQQVKSLACGPFENLKELTENDLPEVRADKMREAFQIWARNRINEIVSKGEFSDYVDYHAEAHAYINRFHEIYPELPPLEFSEGSFAKLVLWDLEYRIYIDPLKSDVKLPDNIVSMLEKISLSPDLQQRFAALKRYSQLKLKLADTSNAFEPGEISSFDQSTLFEYHSIRAYYLAQSGAVALLQEQLEEGKLDPIAAGLMVFALQNKIHQNIEMAAKNISAAWALGFLSQAEQSSYQLQMEYGQPNVFDYAKAQEVMSRFSDQEIIDAQKILEDPHAFKNEL